MHVYPLSCVPLDVVLAHLGTKKVMNGWIMDGWVHWLDGGWADGWVHCGWVGKWAVHTGG